MHHSPCNRGFELNRALNEVYMSIISVIHKAVQPYIHIPKSLDKLILFIPLALIWTLTIPVVGLIIVVAIAIFCAVNFSSMNEIIGVGVVCGLMTILHVIDIIGRVKGGESSSGDDLEDDSNPLL